MKLSNLSMLAPLHFLKRKGLLIEYSFETCQSGNSFWICTKLGTIVPGCKRELFSPREVEKVDDVI